MKKYLFIFISFLLISCSSYQIHQFYLGDGDLQYFVPPTEFESDDNKISIDFTLRDRSRAKKESILTINFSMFSEEIPKYIDKAYFLADNEEIILDSMKLLFRDLERNEIRYSTKADPNKFKTIFQSQKTEIVVLMSDKKEIFTSDDFEASKEKVRNKIIPNLQ